MDLLTIQSQVETIAHEAGQLLRDYFDRPHQFETKSTDADLVTEADKASEAIILQQLRNLFPDHSIVSEEGGGYTQESDYRWFVDPLDGTTNFSHKVPHFSVSIALIEGDTNPLIGVVYDPMRKECFSAARGHGAFLNKFPLHVSKTALLSQAMVVSGFPYDKWIDPDNNATQWGYFVKRVRGIRRFGSAALDLAYVAAGRMDGYWEKKLHPWDMMAGILLVTEAGGKVTDYHGEQTHVFAPRPAIVASNGLIHNAMLEVLQRGDAAPIPTAHKPF